MITQTWKVPERKEINGRTLTQWKRNISLDFATRNAYNSKLAQHFVPGERNSDEENLCHSGVDESLSSTCPVNSISMASKFSGLVVQKNDYPYLRKEATGVRLGDRNVGLAAVIVQTLTKDFQRNGVNVTCENYFTNLSLAETLAKQKN